ncbi:hypothetical protein [endosymbiont DhMRE of Dentiscutata heterogama]|uniref:hypothetical protein n=1 Tax=endosymbiont DhMRE of Dentiscutata heterogama TaxID=1609546 RepID=UPI002AD3DE65|nr:hypothetical protein [endosymbiont DhMRE of Dentiscutata heterogama]
MVKLLNIKLRTNKTNCTSLSDHRIIGLVSQAEITDQNGTKLTQIKNKGPAGGQIQISDLTEIQVDSDGFDIPISWAWENRGGGGYWCWNNY